MIGRLVRICFMFQELLGTESDRAVVLPTPRVGKLLIDHSWGIFGE